MAGHPLRPGIRLLDGHFYASDPHPHFAWMRSHAPVYRDPESGVWGVALHADVRACSRSPELFCNRGGQRPDAPPIPSMINLDDPQHKRRRNLVARGFTRRRVADREPELRRSARALVDRALELGRFDFVKEVAAPLPMIAIGDLLGVRPEDRDRLLRWSDDLILGTSQTAAPETAAAAARAFQDYAAWARQAVAERRRSGSRDDLIGVLVHAEIDGERLDDDALIHETLLILVGGDETTRHVISGGAHQLMRHPEQWRLLRDEPGRIADGVEEMLRWVTPIQNMNRTATRDLTLGGQAIRRGDKVLLLYPSANRDESVFAEPFRFDVTRRPNDHLAFGTGAHFCLGAALARLELRVLFEELLARVPGLEPLGPGPPALRPSNFITGIGSLPVEVSPRPPR